MNELQNIMTPEDWKLVSEKINVVFLLSDLQENLVFEIEKRLKNKGALKFEVKHYVNQLKNTSRLMVQHVNRYAPVHNDNFAHDADKLKEIIDREFFNETTA